MKVVCIAPEWAKYKGEVTKITFPTPQGMLTILPWHYHMITTISTGSIDIYPVVAAHTSQLQDFHEDIQSIPVKQWFCLVWDDWIHLNIE